MVHMSHIHLCGGWLLKLKMKEDGSVPKRCSEVKMKEILRSQMGRRFDTASIGRQRIRLKLCICEEEEG
jgi:hypothetical protein